MKRITQLLLIIFINSSCNIIIQGQQIITSTGGNATGSGGSVSYTVGQVTYQIIPGTNGSAIQGVQQPYEISVVTAIVNTEGINLDYKVYPNPAHGLIKLSIKPFDDGNFRYCLYDLNGILLQNKKVIVEETEISLESLYPLIYFLKVFKDNKEVKVFKIVKK